MMHFKKSRIICSCFKFLRYIIALVKNTFRLDRVAAGKMCLCVDVVLLQIMTTAILTIFCRKSGTFGNSLPFPCVWKMS